jgi:hypothetical protein
MTTGGLNGLPLTRPSATLSPSDGERAGVRGLCWIHPILFGKWYKSRQQKQRTDKRKNKYE